MGIIDFSGGKAENQALDKRQKELNKLQGESNRFQYPGFELPREFDSLLGFSWDGLNFPVNDVGFEINWPLL